METLKKLTGQPFNDPTLFAVATHANHLALPVKNVEPMTLDICGLGSEQPLANYDPNTQFWKTLEVTSELAYTRFVGIWPTSGMTQNGKLLARPRLVPRTLGNGYLLLPTPRATSAMGEKLFTIRKRLDNGAKYKHRLEEWLALQTEAPSENCYMAPEWVEQLMGFPIGWTDLKD
jgi:hypothetical protein